MADVAETIDAVPEAVLATLKAFPNKSPETSPLRKRVLNVCVLNSSYEGSDSPMKPFDDLNVGPHHYFDPRHPDPCFLFTVHSLKKATSYRDIRALAKSGEFDVFYNLCDASKEEDRAGVEVVAALEEFNVPFTGAISKWFELVKPDMKMIAYYNGILTAKSALVESIAEAQRKCSLLRFPLLIKHPSGWSSVGMTKDCKCHDMPSLLARLETFLATFQTALIEEFIDGEEVTVLACGDSTQPDGVRVFQPVTIDFPPGEDFKHFDLKWVEFGDMQWRPLPKDHKAYQKVIRIAAQSFKHMMGGVGYGRTDIRIDRATGEPYFLEINPQPGMMYPPGQEASSDWIIKMDAEWSHQSFAALQIREAVLSHATRQPVYRRDFDVQRGYHLRAAKPLPKGTVVIRDEGRPQRLFTRPWVEQHWTDPKAIHDFKTSAWPVGRDGHIYAVWNQEPSTWHSFNHCCDPNMRFDGNRSLNCVAVRDIEDGEELTMDYRTFMDDLARPFDCNCGSANCAKRIVFSRVPEGLLETPPTTPETRPAAVVVNAGTQLSYV